MPTDDHKARTRLRRAIRAARSHEQVASALRAASFAGSMVAAGHCRVDTPQAIRIESGAAS